MNQGARANQIKAEERAVKVESLKTQGLNYQEIAEAMGVSPEVARQIVSRQRKRGAVTTQPRFVSERVKQLVLGKDTRDNSKRPREATGPQNEGVE